MLYAGLFFNNPISVYLLASLLSYSIETVNMGNLTT